MSDLDPLLLRAFKAGRAENPDSVPGKARALAALGLSPTPQGPTSSPQPAPSGPRLVSAARSMPRSPWWPLVVTVFVAGGATWFMSDGQTTPASQEAAASAGMTTSAAPLAEASPGSTSAIGMTLPVPPEPAPPPSVKAAETKPEPKAPSAVVPPRADHAARISTLSVEDLPNARGAVRGDAKGAAIPTPGKSMNPPCAGCDSPSGPERSEEVGTTTGAGASLREEIEALERASSALSERHCALARRALAAYRSTFPKGKLGREADVVEIEITGRSGDIEGARVAARRFVERFPNNPYSLRLRPWLQPRESDSASNVALCVDATR